MSAAKEAVAAGFSPVSLAEVDKKAPLLTRRDNKYFLNWEVFERFAETLHETHAVLEIGGRRVFEYDTTYFDTPSLDCYRAYVQGRRKQFKCRGRHYVGSGLCFFEVKLKGGRGETIKRRMEYPLSDFGTVSPTALDFLRRCLREAYGAQIEGSLRPTLGTPYRRMTLVAREGSERVTCDSELSFVGGHGSVADMSGRYVMVETKSERGRGLADRVLWRMGHRPVKGSKYCSGIALLWSGAEGSNVLRRTLKGYFSDPAKEAIRPRLTSYADR